MGLETISYTLLYIKTFFFAITVYNGRKLKTENVFHSTKPIYNQKIVFNRANLIAVNYQLIRTVYMRYVAICEVSNSGQ